MSGPLKRSLATLVIAVMAGGLAAETALANGGGSIQGKITFNGGPLNSDCTLRVLSADEEVTATTILNADGTYKIPGLPPGRYRMEVLDPRGRLLWRGDIVAETGVNTLNIDIPPYPKSRAKLAAAASGAPAAGSSAKWWWIGGAIGGAIALGASGGGGGGSNGGGCDNDASPSVPGCQ
jgi:hypothetical protein